MEESKITSKRELSAQWIKNNIYDALYTTLERRMKCGCNDIQEYLSQLNALNLLTNVQLKNQELMIIEMGILIENSKEIVEEDKYKESSNKLKAIKLIFYEGIKCNGKKLKSFKIWTDQQNKKRRLVLTEVFVLLERKLTELRSELISNLSSVLFSGEEGEED